MNVKVTRMKESIQRFYTPRFKFYKILEKQSNWRDRYQTCGCLGMGVVCEGEWEVEMRGVRL